MDKRLYWIDVAIDCAPAFTAISTVAPIVCITTQCYGNKTLCWSFSKGMCLVFGLRSSSLLLSSYLTVRDSQLKPEATGATCSRKAGIPPARNGRNEGLLLFVRFKLHNAHQPMTVIIGRCYHDVRGGIPLWAQMCHRKWSCLLRVIDSLSLGTKDHFSPLLWALPWQSGQLTPSNKSLAS